jgi:TM2 domain-containing membrane protein YozV
LGAALISAIIPGLGQIVTGRVVLGLAILAGAAFAWYYAREIWPILIIHFCAAWHVFSPSGR